MRTVVTPGSGNPIEFVSAADEKGGAKDAVTEKIKAAKLQAKQDWNDAMKQAHEPGKMRRAELYVRPSFPSTRNTSKRERSILPSSIIRSISAASRSP